MRGGHFVNRRRVGSAGLAITIRPDQAERGGVEMIPQPGAAPSPQRVQWTPFDLPHTPATRILTMYRAEVYRALSQAGPGNDINAG